MIILPTRKKSGSRSLGRTPWQLLSVHLIYQEILLMQNLKGIAICVVPCVVFNERVPDSAVQSGLIITGSLLIGHRFILCNKLYNSPCSAS